MSSEVPLFYAESAADQEWSALRLKTQYRQYDQVNENENVVAFAIQTFPYWNAGVEEKVLGLSIDALYYVSQK